MLVDQTRVDKIEVNKTGIDYKTRYIRLKPQNYSLIHCVTNTNKYTRS